MLNQELIDKSIYIITEYYNNNLQPYFEHLSEDTLWIGPADGQEMQGRKTIVSAFSSEQHELTFTMGPIRSVCVPLNEAAYEIILQYEIYTHFPDGHTDLHNQRLQYSWCKTQVPTANGLDSCWEIAAVHLSNTWRYDSRDLIYPVHYETVDQYMYNNCDYFISLDAKNNSYNMISGQAGTFLLPEGGTDYEQDIKDYTNTFVVEEDRERVMREISLTRVVDQIELYGVHSFTYGIMDSNRGYTRKRLDYRYQDKQNQVILMSRTDITNTYLEEEKKRMELEQALARAQTDSLTKLLNVRALSGKIEAYLADKSQKYALYFIDLDDFKGINDQYGHPAGDSVLINIANALRTIQGNDHIIGRVGGDEFVYFAPVSDRKQAAEIAQRICYVIHSVKIYHNTGRRVTCSVGIGLAPEDGQDYETLIQKADQGLYKAKKNGKNRYNFFLSKSLLS